MSNFIEDLKTKVYCRISDSPIHGVGVFAIRDIPVGIDPMQEQRNCEFDEIPVVDVQNDPDIPVLVKQLVKDMCPEVDGVYYIPNGSMNEIGVSFYLNHSKTPNMGELDGNFVTLVPIKEGDELTVDYTTYGELNFEET